MNLTPEVNRSLDYYPGGSIMPGRKSNEGTYRYGFNGMEKDDEIKGNDNSYDFGARIYDPRVGRWLSQDPRFKEQPDWSPYKAFLDNPLLFNDPDGEIEKITIVTINQGTGKVEIAQSTSSKVMTNGTEVVWDNNATYHLENNYYDYKTTIVRTIASDGSVLETSKSEITGNKIKESDYVFFNYQKVDEGGTRDIGTPYVSKTGGLIIWGDASNSDDSPAQKTTGKIYGTFDYSAFMKIMGLVLTAVKDQDKNTLGPKKLTPENAAKFLDKTKKLRNILKTILKVVLMNQKKSRKTPLR